MRPARFVAAALFSIAALAGAHMAFASSSSQRAEIRPHIVFFRERDHPFRREIVLASADGKHQRPLVEERPGGAFQLSSSGDVAVSPDGSKIAFVGNEVGSPSGIFTIDPSGSRPEFIPGTVEGLAPVFSGDGRHLLFAMTSSINHANVIREVDLADGRSRQLKGARAGVAYVPTSSAPGMPLLVNKVSDRGGSLAADVAELTASGRLRILLRQAVGASFSPGARRVAFSKVSSLHVQAIWTADVDGRHAKRLVGGARSLDLYPDWAGAGRILFVGSAPGTSARQSLGVDGSIQAVDSSSGCVRTLVPAEAGTTLRHVRWLGPEPAAPDQGVDRCAPRG
jgi:Tol biopolymer transport system component